MTLHSPRENASLGGSGLPGPWSDSQVKVAARMGMWGARLALAARKSLCARLHGRSLPLGPTGRKGVGKGRG